MAVAVAEEEDLIFLIIYLDEINCGVQIECGDGGIISTGKYVIA